MILGEMTVTRLADDRFYALSAAAAELRDRDWLTQSLLQGERVQIDNVTEDRGVLVLSGPKTRELLQGLTDAQLGNEDFPWLTGREIPLLGGDVRALRVSYVGELGWELHPPIEALPKLYEALFERGRALGIANYGLYAVNSMRIEKGYKAWSSELTNELNMLEADMSRFFAAKKDDFVGKAATLSRGAATFQDRLCGSRCRRHRCPRRRAGARGRPLHRRDHLGRLRPSSAQEPRVRVRPP
jgi:dimethylglycine dehydrogenase